MPTTNDKPMALDPDEVFADIIQAGDSPLDAAPNYPCPGCGAETKEHHTPKKSRICSNRRKNEAGDFLCRRVMDDPAMIEASRQMGIRIQPIIIPCPTCGSPTKEHHTPEDSRICSSATCRTVLELGTFHTVEEIATARAEGRELAPKESSETDAAP